MKSIKRFIKPVLAITIIIFIVAAYIWSDSFFFEKSLTRRMVIRKVTCLDCQQKEGVFVGVHKIQFEIVYEIYRKPKGIAAFPDGGIPKYLVNSTQAYSWDLDKNILQKMDTELPWQQGTYSTTNVFGYPTNLKEAASEYERSSYFRENNFSTENDFSSAVMIQAVKDLSSGQLKNLTAKDLGLPFK